MPLEPHGAKIMNIMHNIKRCDKRRFLELRWGSETMEVVNRVLPNGEQMAGFLKDPETGPIYMVNLLKFKARAEYDDGRASSLP